LPFILFEFDRKTLSINFFFVAFTPADVQVGASSSYACDSIGINFFVDIPFS
jgi:hypothetical protein